ncbi:MAG: GreA/GreB family elongation factor [Stellaceae bacterium]
MPRRHWQMSSIARKWCRQSASKAVSVLSPVGSALLGLSIGQTIDWPLPHGRLKRIRVVEVVYQPEAAGHLHL